MKITLLRPLVVLQLRCSALIGKFNRVPGDINPSLVHLSGSQLTV